MRCVFQIRFLVQIANRIKMCQLCFFGKSASTILKTHFKNCRSPCQVREWGRISNGSCRFLPSSALWNPFWWNKVFSYCVCVVSYCVVYIFRSNLAGLVFPLRRYYCGLNVEGRETCSSRIAALPVGIFIRNRSMCPSIDSVPWLCSWRSPMVPKEHRQLAPVTVRWPVCFKPGDQFVRGDDAAFLEHTLCSSSSTRSHHDF